MNVICLTPDDLDTEAEQPPVYAQPQEGDVGWWEISDRHDGFIVLHTRELANLPPVKAALDALRATLKQIRHDNESEATQMAVDLEMGVSSWEQFMPTAWHKGQDALAAMEGEDNAPL